MKAILITVGLAVAAQLTAAGTAHAPTTADAQPQGPEEPPGRWPAHDTDCLVWARSQPPETYFKQV